MIGRIRGRLVERTPGRVIVDVGGVGYVLYIPLSTFYKLSGSNGEDTEFHVHTHVREEALQLYGFATPEERTLFDRLLSVSGVGPKVALAVLSGVGAQELEAAVHGGDRARLERIPGIGRKTAERILLDLRDRLDAGRRPARRDSAAREDLGPSGAGLDGLRGDALSALVNLGYPAERAREAVDEALASPGEGDALEPLLRGALRRLAR